MPPTIRQQLRLPQHTVSSGEPQVERWLRVAQVSRRPRTYYDALVERVAVLCLLSAIRALSLCTQLLRPLA